jgi:sugar lactone lactonase YvrE
VNRNSAEVAVPCAAELGEGPIWDDRAQRLYWVDILNGDLHWLDESGHHSEQLEAPLSAVAPGANLPLLFIYRDTVVAGRPPGAVELAHIRLPKRDMRLNDAKCDPTGRLWAGTMSTNARPVASLYSIDEQLRVKQHLTGLTISNGLGWSPDGTQMYHIDSPTHRIHAYTFDPESGALGQRRLLAELNPHTGMPDGLCVDTEGFIWVALWEGGALHRYTPNGTLDYILDVPTHCPTSCCFGGADLDVLYITSSRWGAADSGADLEHAGALFAARVGVQGLPATRFNGIDPGATRPSTGTVRTFV